MRKIALALTVLLLVAFLHAVPAQAQATRTWVSGVGDDANPCSRTAPCKTFAGAISKTAPGGEINVLDPGGFGAVTITKSITISSEGFEAGVLVSGTNGIIVSAGASDVVILRGLDIEGLGTGLSGIKVLGVGTLHIEKCTVNGFRGGSALGIDIEPTLAGTELVFIKDTIVRDNGTAPNTGGGILISPAGGVTVKASLNNVRTEGNVFGFKVQGSSTAQVNNSSGGGNVNAGFTNAPGSSTLSLSHSVSTGNGTFGVVCQGTTTVLNDTIFFGNGSGNTTGPCS